MSENEYRLPWKRCNEDRNIILDVNGLGVLEILSQGMVLEEIEHLRDYIIACVNAFGDKEPGECVVMQEPDGRDQPYFTTTDAALFLNLQSENAILQAKLKDRESKLKKVREELGKIYAQRDVVGADNYVMCVAGKILAALEQDKEMKNESS